MRAVADNVRPVFALARDLGEVKGTVSTLFTIGIAQDEATRTNSTVPGAQDIGTNYMAVTGTNIPASFPPYSVTLLTIPPAAPRLAVQLASGGQYVLQVQGQASVRYVVQEATNLTAWTPMATNTLSGAIWSMTNSLSAPVKFWRAVWLP